MSYPAVMTKASIAGAADYTHLTQRGFGSDKRLNFTPTFGLIAKAFASAVKKA
jgi:hypothetical protein